MGTGQLLMQQRRNPLKNSYSTQGVRCGEFDNSTSVQFR